MKKHITIIGATSAIATAVAKRYIQENPQHHLTLISRSLQKLETLKADLTIRGALHIDIDTQLTPKEPIDVLLVATGTIDDKDVQDCIDVNFTHIAVHLQKLIPFFEKQQHGSIAVIGSVAGDRGRQSNYVYGSAKAGLERYLEGLRHHCAPHKVHVLCIKPGFVDTPMTASFKKGLLWATPDTIAKGILKAIQKKKSIVYLPGFWKGIMFIIKNIPEIVFHKTKL